MTITDFLHYLYTQHIDIWIKEGNIFIGMETIIEFPDMNKQEKALRLRLLNNQFAKQQGWLVGNFGEVYSYQFSANGYIFIERHPDETVDVYRCSFNLENKVQRVKGLHEGLTFSEAFLKAQAFLDWLNSIKPNFSKENIKRVRVP